MSEAGNLEQVGKELEAANATEIREKLRKEFGVSEYLVYPFTMDTIQVLVQTILSERFAEDYLLVDTIGRGGSSVVYKSKRLRDGKIFALKEINTKRLRGRGMQHVRTE